MKPSVWGALLVSGAAWLCGCQQRQCCAPYDYCSPVMYPNLGPCGCGNPTQVRQGSVFAPPTVGSGVATGTSTPVVGSLPRTGPTPATFSTNQGLPTNQSPVPGGATNGNPSPAPFPGNSAPGNTAPAPYYNNPR